MVYGSIGGLVSGMDSASIVQQLMQLEALPQTRLKSRVSTQERQVNALQTLNAKIASIATKALELTKPATWAPMKATSTSEHVTVTAGSTAQPTTLSFTVDRLAGSHQVSYANAVRLTDVVATGATVTVDLLDGAGPQSVAAGDGSLDSVVKAINAAGLGVQASAVKADPVDVDGDGIPDEVYRLRVASTATGLSSDFTLGDLDATVLGAGSVTAGQDAKITIGTGAAAVPTTSASNTFTGISPGVDVTLGAATPLSTAVTVTVERDGQAMTDKVKGLVDAVNNALDEIKSLTAYDPATKKGGLLVGESSLRKIRNDLLSSVTAGFNGDSFAGVGIQVDRAGRLVFDEKEFADAYAADPGTVTTKFTAAGGFATKLESLGKQVSDAYDGTLTASIKSRNTSIGRLNDDIAGWDDRLALRRTALERQFASLEVALGGLQNQSSWLAGQLAGLPKWSN